MELKHFSGTRLRKRDDDFNKLLHSVVLELLRLVKAMKAEIAEIKRQIASQENQTSHRK